MVGVGDGGAGDSAAGEKLATWFGGAQAATGNKKAAAAATHVPLPKSLRTERDPKFMARQVKFS